MCKIIKNCIICNKEFGVIPSLNKIQCCSTRCAGISRKGKPAWNKGKKFSEEVRKKMSESKKGKISPCKGKKRLNMLRENHPNWKGGRILHSGGYVQIRCPERPTVRHTGYVLEHRLVMEKHIGRYLRPEEIIHHINGVKSDNRIENLTLTTRQDHPHSHKKYKDRSCLNCKIIIKYHRGTQIYCSRKCNYSHRWNKPISHF